MLYIYKIDRRGRLDSKFETTHDLPVKSEAIFDDGLEEITYEYNLQNQLRGKAAEDFVRARERARDKKCIVISEEK